MVAKLNICLSNECFLLCKGCYNSFVKSGKEVDINVFLEFLSYAASHGVKQITISGGDPLAYQGIDKIIEVCSQKGLIIHLDTVGSTFFQECNTQMGRKVPYVNDLSYIKKVDLLGIPLDGSSDEIISFFRRGRENIFEETCFILSRLMKEKVNVCINSVLHNYNYSDFYNILKIIERYDNIVEWQIFQFSPIKLKANSMIRDMCVPDAIFRDTTSALINMKDRNSLKIIPKSNSERSLAYLLIQADGLAYRYDLNGNKYYVGDIKDYSRWLDILSNNYEMYYKISI